jgi:rod shape determining protein RodA
MTPVLKRLLRRAMPPRGVDSVLVGAAVAIAVLGVLVVWSATRAGSGIARASPFLARQLAWVLLGALVMRAVLATDLERLRRLTPLAYGLAVAALALVVSPLGSSTHGAQAWFDLGPLRLQPAELVKPVLILALAAHGHRAGGHLDRGRLLGALVLGGLPVGLVLLQPDLGTAMVLMVMTAGLVAVAGAPGRHLALLGVLAGVAVLVVLRVGVLAPYQVERLTGFLHQSADPRGATWNLEQAKIAIGSGGLAGSGLFEGSQTALSYVPEQHTDFVFTVVGEELGLLGGATLLGLFAVVAWRTWRAAWLAPDTFGSLCCVGVLAMLVFQVFENMGMTMGITPITGIPLPFVSYGGSSTVACFAGIGLVANVSRRRPPARGTVGGGAGPARLVST